MIFVKLLLVFFISVTNLISIFTFNNSEDKSFLFESRIDGNNSNITDWAITKIQINEAKAVESGSSNIKVGILDTGISYHSCLSNNINSSLHADFTIGNYEPVLINTPFDTNGHGTSVASVIGGYNNINGVCSNVSLVMLKIVGGNDTATSLINAINYAKNNNINILNYSGGILISDSQKIELLRSTIQSYSGLIICAAGNSHENLDQVNYYPQALSLDNILVVGGTNENDYIWSNSSYGQSNVDLLAPATNIKVADLNDGITINANGTSYSAPFVTGTAVLLKSKFPNMTYANIKRVIMNNIDFISGYQDKCVTSGRLNVYKSISFHDNGHDYYLFTDYNNTYHYSKCYCGVAVKQVHAVLAGTNSCIYCGRINSGGIIGPTNIIDRSENGSYLLDTGIIVLDEKDTSSYLSNTLFI